MKWNTAKIQKSRKLVLKRICYVMKKDCVTQHVKNVDTIPSLDAAAAWQIGLLVLALLFNTFRSTQIYSASYNTHTQIHAHKPAHT